MTLSTPLQHVQMMRWGWDNASLNEMSEDEFLFWFETEVELNELIAEAEQEAASN